MFTYLFSERGKGREREREREGERQRNINVREKHQLAASLTPPTKDLAHNSGGVVPCALTGN